MKKLILVVDDEEDILSFMKTILEKQGYDVDTASDGEEALQKAKLKKYDLVFTDSMMPKMNGLETCKAIKAIHPETIVVFTTGSIDQTTLKREIDFAEAGGQIHHLYKPFTQKEILDTADKLLRNA